MVKDERTLEELIESCDKSIKEMDITILRMKITLEAMKQFNIQQYERQN